MLIEVDRESFQNWVVIFEKYVEHSRSKMARRLAKVALEEMKDDFGRGYLSSPPEPKPAPVVAPLSAMPTAQEMLEALKKVESDPEKMTQLRMLQLDSKKIDAIKSVRSWTGMWLKDAKDFVDQLWLKWEEKKAGAPEVK